MAATASVLQQIHGKIICRKTEIDTLLILFGERSSFTCPAIFICGHTATGKSFVVETLLKDLEVGMFSFESAGSEGVSSAYCLLFR